MKPPLPALRECIREEPRWYGRGRQKGLWDLRCAEKISKKEPGPVGLPKT